MTPAQLAEHVDALLSLGRVECLRCEGAGVVEYGPLHLVCSMCEGMGWVLEMDEEEEGQ